MASQTLEQIIEERDREIRDQEQKIADTAKELEEYLQARAQNNATKVLLQQFREKATQLEKQMDLSFATEMGEIHIKIGLLRNQIKAFQKNIVQNKRHLPRTLRKEKHYLNFLIKYKTRSVAEFQAKKEYLNKFARSRKLVSDVKGYIRNQCDPLSIIEFLKLICTIFSISIDENKGLAIVRRFIGNYMSQEHLYVYLLAICLSSNGSLGKVTKIFHVAPPSIIKIAKTIPEYALFSNFNTFRTNYIRKKSSEMGK